jgi:hypothetical protein
MHACLIILFCSPDYMMLLGGSSLVAVQIARRLDDSVGEAE